MNRGDSDKPLGNGGFSRVSDFLVVATAIISAAISIWSIKKSTKFEQEWNQKQLDADLKSKARIEWIQKVRENTAELISLYYKMLKETNKDSLFEQLREAKRMNDLLILYFGPEDNEGVDDFSVLECTETNSGKNDVLVRYLSSLFAEFNEYYQNTSRDVLSIIKRYRKDLGLSIEWYLMQYKRILNISRKRALEEIIIGLHVVN